MSSTRIFALAVGSMANLWRFGTVRRIHSALQAALGQAHRWSWVFENVADHATPPRDEPAEMRPPTPGQVAQLLEFVAIDPALHLYLTLAATTGARGGQLLALRWIDVDLVGGVSAFSAP